MTPGYCQRRTLALDEHARRRNGITPLVGPLPHVYGSRVRTMSGAGWGEWSRARCSWCGAVQP